MTRLLPYGAAVLAALAGALLRLALAPLLGQHYPLGTFYAAVAIVGWFWGVAPSVFAAAVGYCLATILFLSARDPARFDGLELTMYVAICAALIIFTYRIFERQRRLDRALAAQAAATQALADQDTRFKQYLDAMPDIVYTLRGDGSLEYVSPRWAQYTGAESATDAQIAERVPATDLARLIKSRDQAFRDGTALRAEFRLRDRAGQLRWFLTRCVPIRNRSGTVTGWVGSSSDVDEEKRAGEALDQARQRLEVVTDRMSVGVAQCNRQLEYVWANPAYARQVGLAPEQMPGRRIQDLVGAEAFERLQPYFVRVLAGESVQYEGRESISGQPSRWIDAVYTPIWNGASQPVGWVAVVNDLSERRALEEQLREANRQKDQFLATLAHELRNPLAPIRYATRLLKPGVPAEMAADASRMIDRQLGHMARLLDDLLDVSRITRGSLEIRQDALDLRATLQQAVDVARPLAEAVQHKLVLSLPEHPLPVRGDETRLIQVIGNLLNNALKYTDAGGQISVSASSSTTGAVVSVRDNGSGIPAQLLPNVFDLFTQGERGSRSQTGLGIGLALARQIVELHGGSIEAHSDGPGKGSEFRVVLPLVDEVPALRQTRPEASNVTVLGADGVSVLIVDDNVDAADSLAHVLKAAGYQTHVSYDGRTALEMAEILKPSVVLLDLGLPHLSGREVAQRLRALPWARSARLIAITGWGGEDDVRRSLEAGFDQHLTKPVDPDVLLHHMVRLTHGAGVANGP